jgi:hypothetical protein
MPEDLPENKAEGEAPAPPRDLGWSFAIGMGLALITFFVACVVESSLIYPLLPSPSHEVGDAILRVVIVYWALVAAEIIAGVVLRTALSRVAVGNALIIAALLSAAFLLILGILKGLC